MVMDLLHWVAQRIDEDEDLSAEAGLLVLAALDSDAALNSYLDGGGSPLLPPDTTLQPETEPVGAYLESLQVQGFRGIGKQVTLELTPQPGLTIISGRNGSGKSSLAEALEVALTGSTYRWKNKAAQWKEQWRNLHDGDAPEVLVKFTEEGAGITTVGTSWTAGTEDVAEFDNWVQRPGAKRQAGMGSLGWSCALDTFRPLMSYDELGGMLEAGPSTLYDALSKALGVEAITIGIARLDRRAKSIKEPGDAATAQKTALLRQVEILDDERAREVRDLLKKREMDTARLRALATGEAAVDPGPVAALRGLDGLAPPTAADVAEAVARLREAVGAMAVAGEAESARNLARLDLRKQALQVHEQFGDMVCPVCATGDLDEVWATTTKSDVDRRSVELADLERAREELERARAGARRLVSKRPAALDRAPLPSLEDDVRQSRGAWDLWGAEPTGDLELASHLEATHPELEDSLRALRAAVSAELQARQDVWTPIAGRLARLCDDWDHWLITKEAADVVAAALKWLKANDTRLKNERLAPIGDAARAAWSLLRQESNVDLGSLTLEGTSTRRRVAIGATVDGYEAGALAVMSQGELHALSLALFLPRASMPESPFRFVVLDDPVQAMDPAKVEGLVALLADLATTRQVIVLSHDDRLPAAARRARVGARILEVTRGAGSKVAVVTVADPAQRYLSDAFALVKDEGLPEGALRRTLPGLLRFAVEAAARDVTFARRLVNGARLSEVEALWAAHYQTRDRVSLAIFDETRNLDTWLTRGYRKLALGVVTSAVHDGLWATTDPGDACRAVEDLVKDMRLGIKQ